MKKLRIIAAVLALSLLLPCFSAFAETPEMQGYQRGKGWQYLTFGNYPYKKDGTIAPITWRLLKIEDGTAFIITNWIIDFVTFHDEKDLDPDHPLKYKDTIFCSWCNTTAINDMFTKEEQSVLIEMEDGRGYVSAATFEEFCQTECGFITARSEDPNRIAQGTPFALQQGLKKIAKGNSWYWTANRCRPGYRFIVADNGHMSISGANRKGGFRPVVYVKLDMIEIASGKGTLDDPFVWTVKTAE